MRHDLRSQQPGRVPARAVHGPFDPMELRHAYLQRADRLYRRALLLRALILGFSAVAVLPDSALVFGVADRTYSLVTTAAGAFVAAAFVVLKATRIVDSMNQASDVVTYLDSRRAELLTADGLTRRRIHNEIETEIAAREAQHRSGVLEGLGGVLPLPPQSKEA